MTRNQQLEKVFRALVVGVMAGCVAWSLVQLILLFSPAWNPAYLVAGCVLASLEAYYSYWLLQTPRMRGADVLRFRVVELSLIFLSLRIGRFVGKSGSEILAEIQSWPHQPTLMFDLETMAAFVLALLCWMAATETARDLRVIGEPPEWHRGHVFPIQRLTGRFFSGGAVLLAATGLARLGSTSELLNLRRPSVRGLILNVLIYFLLGVVMLGQARFVELRRRWQGQDMQMADDVPGRWIRYSLSFIGLAALLAFVLPTGFALGLLDVAASSLGVIGAVLYYVASLLITILFLPLVLLIWLLSTLLGARRSPPRAQLPSFEPPPPGPEGGGTMGWLEIVQALVFFAAVLGGVFYVVRSYLRDHPELREALVTLRPIRVLRRGWAAFWRWLRAWTARLGQTVKENLPRRLPRRLSRSELPGAPFRFFRLGALSPRERVLYYYLSILRRAGKQGFPRRHHQTPREYYAALEPDLPQAQDEMEALTEAVMEARYSRHEVEPEQARWVRTNWERVKAALRTLKRQRDSEE
jgi:hypothetical protein